MTETNLNIEAKEIEEALISTVLNYRDTVEVIRQIVSENMFSDLKIKEVYRAVTELYNDNIPVDLITVTNLLKKKNKLNELGGAYYISQLTNILGDSAHVEYHANIIREKYLAREIISICQNTSQEILNGEDVVNSAELLESRIKSIFDSFSNGIIKHISEPVHEAMQAMKRRVELAKENKFSGIPTGISKLDKMTTGWQKGELTVIAARPAMGKTATLLHFAKSAYTKSKSIPAIFSLEMTDVSLADRLILSETSIHPDRYRLGYLNQNELLEIEKAKELINKMEIYVDDKPSVSMDYIRNKAKILKREKGCDLILIDYLQLACEQVGRNGNREQEISQMSQKAKRIAKELKVPVILLSQLSRQVEQRGGNKKPQLSDLRESGAIEQDADNVIFIYRPSYYGYEQLDNGMSTENYGEFIIAKQRNGATGKVEFSHNVGLTRIYDYETINQF